MLYTLHTTVAASVVSEVILREDLNASYLALSQSLTQAVMLFISAYSDYYSVQMRLVGFYWLGWAKYANSWWYGEAV